MRHGIVHSYPSLYEDLTVDIAIIGGGISGALSAWYLSKAGYKVVVVDRRHIGMGSTAASTALLQYEIDTPLVRLIPKIGEQAAIRSYLMCRQAIDDIGALCNELDCTHSFRRVPSFQFASYQKDRQPMREEYLIRKKIGFRLQWLEEKDILEKYGFSKSAGILSKDGAWADAYRLTHALLLKSIRKYGTRVHDHTEAVSIRHTKRGVELLTAQKKKIRAKRLVIACGFESQQYLPMRVQRLRSTYAIVSEPCHQQSFWYKNSLIWETADPYIYMRTTQDNRILLGGKDIFYADAVKRDRLISAKTRALEKTFFKLFPSIPFKTDFSWAGTFATTKDGLPYIGSIRQLPHTYFALGFGGNGTTFSIIAAQIIRDIIGGKKNEDREIFSFDR
jgi:glycine/D-amino acid oxidase-like deaminating enzyme